MAYCGKSRSSSPVLPRLPGEKIVPNYKIAISQVEAKKALSREEQQTSARSSNFNQGKNFGGGGNIRTKKIFVGRLPPTLTEDGLISNSSAHDFLFALVIVMVSYSSSNRRVGYRDLPRIFFIAVDIWATWVDSDSDKRSGGEMLESSKVESSAHSWMNLSFLVGVFTQDGVGLVMQTGWDMLIQKLLAFWQIKIT
ncbi:hypothetical protein GOBAR_AA01570 [Gossypium barbadense]|uniref:Uncharacterized protein n=1 Tax=Gossypium barbadense TaxID=3634 RepID=A0A2P5YTY5_GOSBA|nr:hypothetical protein GOBAR_AA01570 [Gossypium barbadense]